MNLRKLGSNLNIFDSSSDTKGDNGEISGNCESISCWVPSMDGCLSANTTASPRTVNVNI